MPPATEQAPSNPLSHERVVEAIVSTLTTDQLVELARETISARLGETPVAELLKRNDAPPVVSRQPQSLVQPRRDADKDYLGGIVDVTVVSVDKLTSNKSRIIFKDGAGRHYMWDATSGAGLALEAGHKRRITATLLGKEGGHLLIGRVRFYDKSAKPPVRFTR